jgi:hypothetical protein
MQLGKGYGYLSKSGVYWLTGANLALVNFCLIIDNAKGTLKVGKANFPSNPSRNQ